MNATQKAKPILLEPIMHVELTAPNDDADDVMSSIVSRRGVVTQREDRDGTAVIQARAPLSGMLGYAEDLRARTRARATYTMQLDGYEPLGEAEGHAGGEMPVRRDATGGSTS